MPRKKPRPVPFHAGQLQALPRFVLPGAVFRPGGGGIAFYRPEFGHINVSNIQQNIALLTVTAPPDAPGVTLAPLNDMNARCVPLSEQRQDDGTTISRFAATWTDQLVVCAGSAPVAVLASTGDPHVHA